MNHKMDENVKNIITIIIGSIILVVILGYKIYTSVTTKKVEVIEPSSSAITIVKEESRYYTVINSINKYLNYVQNQEYSNILLILDEEYKSFNNINATNVNQYIPNLSKNNLCEYIGDEMYQKKISETITEYYVHGNIAESTLDEPNILTNYDITITLYESNFVFTVKPGVEK